MITHSVCSMYRINMYAVCGILVKDLQNMLISIDVCQYFTNNYEPGLRIRLHTTFIRQIFGLKLCQNVPMA